jgi:hypothetical protein
MLKRSGITVLFFLFSLCSQSIYAAAPGSQPSKHSTTDSVDDFVPVLGVAKLKPPIVQSVMLHKALACQPSDSLLLARACAPEEADKLAKEYRAATNPLLPAELKPKRLDPSISIKSAATALVRTECATEATSPLAWQYQTKFRNGHTREQWRAVVKRLLPFTPQFLQESSVRNFYNTQPVRIVGFVNNDTELAVMKTTNCSYYAGFDITSTALYFLKIKAHVKAEGACGSKLLQAADANNGIEKLADYEATVQAQASRDGAFIMVITNPGFTRSKHGNVRRWRHQAHIFDTKTRRTHRVSEWCVDIPSITPIARSIEWKSNAECTITLNNHAHAIDLKALNKLSTPPNLPQMQQDPLLQQSPQDSSCSEDPLTKDVVYRLEPGFIDPNIWFGFGPNPFRLTPGVATWNSDSTRLAVVFGTEIIHIFDVKDYSEFLKGALSHEQLMALFLLAEISKRFKQQSADHTIAFPLNAFARRAKIPGVTTSELARVLLTFRPDIRDTFLTRYAVDTKRKSYDNDYSTDYLAMYQAVTAALNCSGQVNDKAVLLGSHNPIKYALQEYIFQEDLPVNATDADLDLMDRSIIVQDANFRCSTTKKLFRAIQDLDVDEVRIQLNPVSVNDREEIVFWNGTKPPCNTPLLKVIERLSYNKHRRQDDPFRNKLKEIFETILNYRGLLYVDALKSEIRQVDLNATDSEGNHALQAAIAKGCFDYAQMILEKIHHDPAYTDLKKEHKQNQELQNFCKTVLHLSQKP